MRFLADESCDAAVVGALRSAGHDVNAIVELSRGATDRVVPQRACLPQAVLDVVAAHQAELLGAFVVIAPSGVRLTRLPAE